MKIKEKLSALYKATNKKFCTQFGFKIEDATFSKIVGYLHVPKDSSSLAVTRILFGLAMLFDIPDERGGATMDKRWGDPNTCHFPLLPFIQPLPMPYMAVVYAGLWFGAMGIMLGFKYRCSAATFTVCYWYLLLVEKSYWNNHSYLFGLVAFLLTFTEANCYWSIDANLDSSKSKTSVPYWNYFILKYQFFILYFMAGMKKGTAEWLTGYSVQHLSEHWVFEPFKLFLSVEQTDFLIVHWFVFVFDLTVAIWMMCATTRHAAMVFCALFHLMNSRLFRIGMFPWVCLATMPLFYQFDWPKKILQKLAEIKSGVCKKIADFNSQQCTHESDENNGQNDDSENDDVFEKSDENNDERDLKKGCKASCGEVTDIKERHENERHSNERCAIFERNCSVNKDEPCTEDNKRKITVYLIIVHVLSQAFLPYSHFITQGYNNWTNGLYGYSWDMMVHTWDTHAVVLQIVDNDNHKKFYVDPYAYTPNERWTRHGDMIYQYAICLRDKLNEAEKYKANDKDRVISMNVSVYVDVWCSLNGRFTQRLFDPKADILKVDWSPFNRMSYVIPLLDEALAWREILDGIRSEVHSWSNNSDVVFLADFPGHEQEKFISEDLKNVTLTVLEGVVAYLPEVNHNHGSSLKLTTGDHVSVKSNIFHKVLNIGQNPAFYMYTFFNNTEVVEPNETSKFPVLAELYMILLMYKKAKPLMDYNAIVMFRNESERRKSRTNNCRRYLLVGDFCKANWLLLLLLLFWWR